MQTPPRRFPEGWSARDTLQPGIFKLPSFDEVSELRYDSEIQIISNLGITWYAVKSLTFKKSWGVMLFKFWWHIEKHLKELGLGPGFSSMSQLSLINLMRYNRYLYLYIYEKQCLIMKDISLKKNTCFKKRIKWNTKLYYCVIEAKW